MGGSDSFLRSFALQIGAPIQELFTANSILKNNWPERIRWPPLQLLSPARTLLLLARYGKEDQPHGLVPKVSQETLAEMVGTTRSRVNFFMNKFRKLGFIKYNGGLQINTSLLSVVLHD